MSFIKRNTVGVNFQYYNSTKYIYLCTIYTDVGITQFRTKSKWSLSFCNDLTLHNMLLILQKCWIGWIFECQSWLKRFAAKTSNVSSLKKRIYIDIWNPASNAKWSHQHFCTIKVKQCCGILVYTQVIPGNDPLKPTPGKIVPAYTYIHAQ